MDFFDLLTMVGGLALSINQKNQNPIRFRRGRLCARFGGIFFVFKRALPKHVIKVRKKRQKTGDKLVKKYKTG